MQLTQAQLDACLGDIIATGKAFDPATTFVGVITAITAGGLSTTLGDCTLGTDGIAAWQEVTTWGSIRHLDSGASAVNGPEMSFAVTNSSDAQTIVAVGIGDASVPTTLHGYILLPEPVPLPDQYHPFVFTFVLSLDPAGQWDASCICPT